MGAIRLFLRDEDGNDEEELGCVETETVDDFYYFRDSIHAALEGGDFGSRFPTFLKRFEPDEWKADEIERLHGELATIAEAFRKMPPKPFDSNWASKLERSGRQCGSLYEVFVDAEGQPLLGRLIELCSAALKAQKSIAIE